MKFEFNRNCKLLTLILIWNKIIIHKSLKIKNFSFGKNFDFSFPPNDFLKFISHLYFSI